MRTRNFSVVSLGLLAAWACSPISPSVHKSTLRPAQELLAPPKAESAPRVVETLRTPIEIRWLNSESALHEELSHLGAGVQIRLSNADLQVLREGSVLRLAVPLELDRQSLDRVRILLRVDLERESLVSALAEETWSFDWSTTHGRQLEIQAGTHTRSSKHDKLADALVSVHILLRESGSP